MRGRRLIGLAFALALACKSPASGTEIAIDATASPQASAMPAPLALPAPNASGVHVFPPEGSPLPVPLRGDVALGPDTLSREAVGYTFSATVKQADLSGPPRSGEVSGAGLEAARKKTELRLAIDASPSRLRLALLGSGWVLPEGTEIRARSDRFGHVMVWPGGLKYRPVAPGALRALLGERRFDVAPITAANIVPKDEPGKRISIRTRKVEVTTRAAKATFELGKLPDLGEGGVLLCRALLDLMNASPSSPVCGDGEVPLRAELRWTARGSLGFEITGVLKRTDMPTPSLLVPPSSAVYADSPLASAGIAPMLSPTDLAAFRTNAVDNPSATHPTDSALTVANGTGQLRVLYIDGVPVVWASPGARDVVHGFHRGRYVAQWRTFLGDSVEPSTAQTVPGTAQVGGADAGK